MYKRQIQDYVEKFQILYSTGELTDVFVTAAENKAAVLDNEIALDISYLDAFDRLSQKNIDTYSRDGKVYAFAPDGWYCGVFYNKRILEENGIEVPTNYEEFNQSMQTQMCIRDRRKGCSGAAPAPFCRQRTIPG